MDTRKRGYEDSLDESSKRAAIDGEGGPVPRPVRDARGHDGDILFKILCPSNAVGAIIGKAGSVLNQLKELTGCKIRVSQNNEFYPGESSECSEHIWNYYLLSQVSRSDHCE